VVYSGSAEADCRQRRACAPESLSIKPITTIVFGFNQATLAGSIPYFAQQHAVGAVLACGPAKAGPKDVDFASNNSGDKAFSPRAACFGPDTGTGGLRRAGKPSIRPSVSQARRIIGKTIAFCLASLLDLPASQGYYDGLA